MQNSNDRFSRTICLIGEDNYKKISNSKVLIAGLGGVGGYAFEAIVRAGVGTVHIIDYDVVEISNCNRQLIAMDSTLGLPKVDVAFKRAKDIHPEITIQKNQLRITPENIASIFKARVDFVIDAIDDVVAKSALIEYLYTQNVPFISCMGAARAYKPESLRIADISKSQYCPLARVIRKRLKEKGITKGVTCVYYHEERTNNTGYTDKENIPGSLSYMPGIMGLAAAGYAINYLIGKE